MTAVTRSGTRYAASVDRGISREGLEALDALADAVLRQWEASEAGAGQGDPPSTGPDVYDAGQTSERGGLPRS